MRSIKTIRNLPLPVEERLQKKTALRRNWKNFRGEDRKTIYNFLTSNQYNLCA
jgi:hypothetical protein